MFATESPHLLPSVADMAGFVADFYVKWATTREKVLMSVRECGSGRRQEKHGATTSGYHEATRNELVASTVGLS